MMVVQEAIKAQEDIKRKRVYWKTKQNMMVGRNSSYHHMEKFKKAAGARQQQERESAPDTEGRSSERPIIPENRHSQIPIVIRPRRSQRLWDRLPHQPVTNQNTAE